MTPLIVDADLGFVLVLAFSAGVFTGALLVALIALHFWWKESRRGW